MKRSAYPEAEGNKKEEVADKCHLLMIIYISPLSTNEQKLSELITKLSSTSRPNSVPHSFNLRDKAISSSDGVQSPEG
ncbi:hypothetical protein D3C85_1411990 [compost metagenome]